MVETKHFVYLSDVEQKVLSLPNVKAVHDTHIWALDGEHNILTPHLVIDRAATQDEVVIKCKAKEIIESFGTDHVTIEIEREGEVCKPEKW